MHPGMRAAADMQKQGSSTGGRGGMFSVILPLYAIGIVLYLVYTLSKVIPSVLDSSVNTADVCCVVL